MINKLPVPITKPLRETVVTIAERGQRALLYRALQAQRDRADPIVNAFEQRDEHSPDDAPGPLNGLPITVKDQIAVAGWKTTSGLDRPARKPDTESAQIVTGLQDIGAVVSGKTALPPHAMDFQTYNRRRGRTTNPFDPNFTAGGSSGGGAAAVASGMSLLDIGADLSGSLRVPAAWCGVASLTPGEGALPTGGMLSGGRHLDHFARVGPIAKSADDLNFLWDCLTGKQSNLGVDGSRHRIMIWTPDAPSPCDATTLAAWRDLPGRLANAGFDCTPDSMLPLFHGERYRLFGEIMGYETGAFLPAPVRWLTRRNKLPARRSPGFLEHVNAGYGRDRVRHGENLHALEEARERSLSMFSDVDALIMPVTGICAFKHQDPCSDRAGMRDYDVGFDTGAGRLGYYDALTRFTVPTGLMGWPIVTLPMALDPNGLPMGMQVVGKPGEEKNLLDLCVEIEKRLDWRALN